MRVLSYTSELSTRTLIEAYLEAEGVAVEFSDRQVSFQDSIRDGKHDLYVIDVTEGQGGRGYNIFSEIAHFKKKQIRVMLIVEEIPPDGANRMENFGALCFIESWFTRERLRSILDQVMKMKDTGCRVKGDSKFFNISVFLAGRE